MLGAICGPEAIDCFAPRPLMPTHLGVTKRRTWDSSRPAAELTSDAVTCGLPGDAGRR